MWEWFLVSVICVGVLGYMVNNAPEGYEDETGFHYGVDPNDQAYLKTK